MGTTMIECKIERVLLCLMLFVVLLYYLNYSPPTKVQDVVSTSKKECASHLESASFQSTPLLTAQDIWNKHKIAYDPVIRAEFDRLMKVDPASNNSELVSLVKSLVDPPSDHPMRKPAHAIFQTPQAKAVDELYKQQRGLFFVEAGALDGERSSNTLWLEDKRGWGGLLVEVDPFFYTQLRGKARRSSSLNACLSGKLEQLDFQECPGGCGRLKHSNSSRTAVPCFSLETMMLALNRTTIDYFSLDVEGHEREVLDAIPWTRINIRAITIEYPDLRGAKRQDGIKNLKTYMTQNGYRDAGQFDEAIPDRDLWNRDILFIKEKQ